MVNNKNQRRLCLEIFSKTGIFSLSLFVSATAVYFYSPTIKSYAESTSKREEGSIVTTDVGSVIALTTSTDKLKMNANLKSFVHDSLNINISTNSQYGYTLALEDADDSSNMHHVDTSITDTVTSAFSGSKTSNNMDDNTWGFSLDNGNYFSIPTLGNPVTIKRTNAAMTSTVESTSIDFGIKVGILTSGTYYDTVKFTAYVNGADGNPSSGVKPSNPGEETPSSSMQTFDCSSIATFPGNYQSYNEDHIVTLQDSRDGNSYEVIKLTDGHCYMRNNLRLIDKTLTSADSDVVDTYVVPESTGSEVNWDVVNTSRAYYDSSKPQIGVYYNWYTATAGTGTIDMGGSDAPNSICPKGWHLPSRAEYQSMLNTLNNDISYIRYVMNYVDAGNVDYILGYPVFTNNFTLWSSTSSDKESYSSTGDVYQHAYTLTNVNHSGTGWNDLDTDRKGFGKPIRCMTD